VIYYTKDGSRSFYPQDEDDRFMAWVRTVGVAIAEPTEEELLEACSRPCSYWRAACEPRT
jgi:hypothetical protein